MSATTSKTVSFSDTDIQQICALQLNQCAKMPGITISDTLSFITKLKNTLKLLRELNQSKNIFIVRIENKICGFLSLMPDSGQEFVKINLLIADNEFYKEVGSELLGAIKGLDTPVITCFYLDQKIEVLLLENDFKPFEKDYILTMPISRNEIPTKVYFFQSNQKN